MSNHHGLKHVSTEPNPVDTKRERRRGAAGRAAALRRAPSDSDCSGETASLSADSGDRAPRPLPPPSRSTNARSRRRGSEWEVLEGLKDGQRYDKRPEVFNGYLHKKRKWPLKGWHKRFFVVDGGILVYARSPTDVARGRLHGSVDVGLSVISAKPRRRRVDIDADEFIYHLRAKTPDVFRTWLNVLKVHRLYRQHLLTFGAREPTPKILAPLEDLLPTDTSSRSISSVNSLPDLTSSESASVPSLLCDKKINPSSNMSTSSNNKRNYNKPDRSELLPLSFDTFNDRVFNLRYFNGGCNFGSPVSTTWTDCDGCQSNKSGGESNKIDTEAHMDSTDLNSVRSPRSSRIYKKYKDIQRMQMRSLSQKSKLFENSLPLIINSDEGHLPTFFFFSQKKSRVNSSNESMRKSKKSTNLNKYKNQFSEPPLSKHLSKHMLLRRKSKSPTEMNKLHVTPEVAKSNDEPTFTIYDQNNPYTVSECDRITEKLVVAVFQNEINSIRSRTLESDNDVKECITQIVKELYDMKTKQDEAHPVKILFRCLLEYWLKNTSAIPFREAVRRVQSVDRQSNAYFTKDAKLSSVFTDGVTKGTQFHGYSDVESEFKQIKANTHIKLNRTSNVGNVKIKSGTSKNINNSYEKDKRIQELEKLLKNTVYICEATNNYSKDKDIKMTKFLLNNLEKLSHNTSITTDDDNQDNSNSSAELPKIKDTINRLISETSMSYNVAKEFLNAYLHVLRSDSSKSDLNTSSQTTDASKQSESEIAAPVCDVQTDCLKKTVSKSVITLHRVSHYSKSTEESISSHSNRHLDPGQLYLKDVIDKVTSIFTKGNINSYGWSKMNTNINSRVKSKENFKTHSTNRAHDQPHLTKKVNRDNNICINLSKCDLENVYMSHNPVKRDAMNITVKFKENDNADKIKRNQPLSFRNNLLIANIDDSVTWIPVNNQHKLKNYIKTIPKLPEATFDLQPYNSSSEGTSKAYCKLLRENERLSNSPLEGHDCLKKANDEAQSCFLMSSLKKNFKVSRHQAKKKVRLKEGNGKVLGPSIVSPDDSQTPFSDNVPVFTKTPPNVIDEKFILLLLENLSLLSKNIPHLHKEINNVYGKLRKKYDKILKNAEARRGLGLLGKIYKKESSVTGNESCYDKGVQYDLGPNVIKAEVEPKILTNLATNTVNNTLVDKSVNVIATELVENDTQTIIYQQFGIDQNSNVNKKCTKEVQTSLSLRTSNSSSSNNLSLDCGVKIPKWCTQICTRDCAASTILKHLLVEEENNASLYIKPSDELVVSDQNPENCGQKCSLKSNLAMSESVLKISSSSHTDNAGRSNEVFGKSKKFDVYQLYVASKFVSTRSGSVSDCNLDIWRKSEELKTLYRCTSAISYSSSLVSPTSPTIRGPQAGFVSGTPGGRLAGWIIESGGPLESVSKELGQAQLSVQQLQRLLEALELQHQVHHDTDVSIEGASPNVKKDRRKFGLRKKKSNSKCASVELAPPAPHAPHAPHDGSSSHSALSTLTAPPSPGGGVSSAPNSAASLPIACAAARPQSLPGAEALGAAGPASISSLTPDHQLREDFTVLAKDLVANLKGIVSTLVCERGRLRAAVEAAEAAGATGAGRGSLAALRTDLTSALHQNCELRSRLSRIHDASDLTEISSIHNSEAVTRPFQHSQSYSSSCVSASEFFDAEEHEDLNNVEIIPADQVIELEADGDSSSEAGSLSSEEGSASSDNSDAQMVSAEPELPAGGAGPGAGPAGGWTRRSRLPAPRPTPGGPSLWNLLYKNIGKDLSQISMPVTINEPLNMLQRLCEELEHCALLELAARAGDPLQRAALVAAFAVSAYAAAAHRAASKPFNPLLHETYECVREDRGFKFVAEQVSHHPPISACHAESALWCFWQEARIKTKFWGKSMEFQPAGRVHVRLATGDHYSWNKVTTCVHNLFGGQRWVDQYGEMLITCHDTDISCKLNFVKASSWSSSRHEVRGAVTGGGGAGALRLQGRWSEALYAGEPPAARCLWRPAPMPPDYELYYGFTQFAMELNEMEPGMPEVLPHTDTRLRPDQRALEQGDVAAAERHKLAVEQAQRDRRRDQGDQAPLWFRKSVECGEEEWVWGGEYWRARAAGFPAPRAPRLW